MRLQRVGRVGVLAGVLIAMAACGTPPATPSVGPSAPMTTPGFPAESAPPRPTTSPAPAAGRRELYPWLPPIDEDVEAAFAADSFVTSAVDVAPVSSEPGGAPFRFDTGDPDPSKHPLVGFLKGGLLVVVHGPILVGDVPWYLLAPAQLGIDIPTGWTPLTSPDGTRLIEAAEFTCPASPLTVEVLGSLALTDGLPACFGDRDVTIRGDLACDRAVEAFVTGPDWVAGPTCSIGSPPTIYGLDPTLTPGRFDVTGHFDDPAAGDCRPADFMSTDLARVEAVLACRRAFVATNAERTPGSGVVGTDSVARVLEDGLRIRSAPGLSSDVVEGGRLDAGDTAFVIEGPVRRDGYDWFHVAPTGSAAAGWVAAAGQDGRAWLVGEAIRCPTSPLGGFDLRNLGAYGGLACFGGRQVELFGSVHCGVADIDAPLSGPTWLRQDRICTIDANGEPLYLYDGGIPGLGLPTTGELVVVGHWDDPAARDCTWSFEPPAPDPAVVVTMCRSLFVATDLRAP